MSSEPVLKIQPSSILNRPPLAYRRAGRGGHTHSLSHHQIYIDGILVGNDFNAGVAYPDDLAVHHIVIKAKDHFSTATNDKSLYIQPNRGSNGYADVYSCEIWDCKLERGNIATDWSPAPEDIDAQFVQTNANISTLEQTATNADQVLSQRIDALDASYKSADNALNASITAETQARTSADNALSQRITALDTAYKSADTQANAKIATLEQSLTDKDSAMSRRVDTLQASYNTLNSTKASTASVTAETQARSTADNALSQRIDNLNSDYQSNKASVTSQLQTLSDADSATAQRLDALQSRYTDNLLASHDSITTANYLMTNIPLRRTLAQGQKVVITVYANLGDDRTGLTLSNTTPHGASALHRFSKTNNGVYQAVVPWNVGVGANNSVLIYHTPQTATSSSTLHHAHIALADAMSAQTDANIATMQQTLSSADQALSSRIDTLDASYKRADTALNASITAEQQARATADNTLSQRIATLDTAYKAADSTLSARIATAEQSASSAHQAIAQAQQTLTAQINAINPIALDYTSPTSGSGYNIARYALSNAPAHGEQVIITIYGTLGTGRTHFGLYNSGGGVLIGNTTQIADGVYQYAGTWTVTNGSRTAANTHLWVYQFASNATSTSTINRITIERTSSAGALQSLSANLDEFKTAQASKDNATARSISTLQTTVNGQTASIQQHAQSLNGLSAQWTLKAESNGIVSGIGLASNNGVSAFAVRADQFYIAPPTGTTKAPLFSVLTTATTVGGVSVPAGVYLSDGYIQNGAITNAKIANGAIDSAKIGNAQISNAHIANGAITTAKIGTAQVDTLQLRGQAVSVTGSVRGWTNQAVTASSRGAFLETASVALDTLSTATTMVDITLNRLAYNDNPSVITTYIIEFYCNGVKFDTQSIKSYVELSAVIFKSIHTAPPNGMAEYSVKIGTDNQHRIIAESYQLTATTLKR